jgi:bacillithiol synthase
MVIKLYGVSALSRGSYYFYQSMDFRATHFSYRQTGYFSKIMLDYLDGAEPLQPFYQHPVSLEGIESAIRSRLRFQTDRMNLVSTLKNQYAQVQENPKVNQNIESLLQSNCFTITTAHQPAIFTGSLYFIYKIAHTIKLACRLAREMPQYQFVPVFCMGSEDADLEELGHIYFDQEKLVWDTQQTGAVGRMKTQGLEKIMDRIEGEYGGLPFGDSLLQTLKMAYSGQEDIQTATFRLIHQLFAGYGLVVLIPDQARLKKSMVPVFEDDLFQQRPSAIVEKSILDLSQFYKVQANPREINLFYLKDGMRERILPTEDSKYRIQGTKILFSQSGIRQELKEHPERFSPNVILRGLFQETILPNIVFIGGGGETSYWLELKGLFEHYQVPFPMLILRNSFLIILNKWREKLVNMELSVTDICRTEEELLDERVIKESQHRLNLEKEMKDAASFYEKLKVLTANIDPSLSQHVDALQAKAIKPLQELEKKILKAEKRKFEDQRRQIHAIKSALFPLEGLQERLDNFMPYYAKWGPAFLDSLLANSLSLEQEFTVLEEL